MNNTNERCSLEQCDQSRRENIKLPAENAVLVEKANSNSHDVQSKGYRGSECSEFGDGSRQTLLERPENQFISSRNETIDSESQANTSPKVLTSNRIPKIFDAIFQEVRHLAPEKPKESNDSVTLREVLESDASLVTERYAIPPAMIDEKAVGYLQMLIDRAEKMSQRVLSANSENLKSNRLGPNLLSCYTTVTKTRNAPNSDSSSTESGFICRICHGNHDTLVEPCLCRGSLAYVHAECLQHWLTQEGISHCELCNYKFNVIYAPEHNVAQSITFWYKFIASEAERKTIINEFTVASVALPLLFLATISVGNDCQLAVPETQYCICIVDKLIRGFVKSAVFLTNIAFYTGLLYRINYHVGVWLHWRANKNVTLVLD